MPKRTAFRLLRLSPAAFYERLNRLKMRCGISPLDRCLKRHPLQLSLPEVQKIKQLFSDSSKACWPAVCLYYYGLRYKKLYISLSTFYKYVNLLGLKRTFAKPIHKRKGLTAEQPNQYLHVDTTEWRLEDGSRIFFAFVSDNFSRAVLGASVALHKTAENVKAAVQQAIATLQKHHPLQQCSALVSDNGSENKAATVAALLQQTERPTLQQLIAQKDIIYSNSPVEAVNKIVKRYLRHYRPYHLAAAEALLPQLLHDYNYQRPHSSLAGCTPMEAYTGSTARNYRAEKQQAKALRLKQNSTDHCQSCS